MNLLNWCVEKEFAPSQITAVLQTVGFTRTQSTHTKVSGVGFAHHAWKVMSLLTYSLSIPI